MAESCLQTCEDSKRGQLRAIPPYNLHTLLLCMVLIFLTQMGTNPKTYHQQRHAAAVALEEAVLLNFQRWEGGERKAFFTSMALMLSSAVQRSVESSIGRRTKICALERGGARVLVQSQGTTKRAAWYMGQNIFVTRQLLGLATFKAVSAAKDLELPLAMVQSIKSCKLVSLRVFDKNVLEILVIAVTTWVLLLPRTPPNTGSKLVSAKATCCPAFTHVLSSSTLLCNFSQFSLYRCQAAVSWITLGSFLKPDATFVSFHFPNTEDNLSRVYHIAVTVWQFHD